MAVREILDNASVPQVGVVAPDERPAVRETVVIGPAARLERALHEAHLAQQRWQKTFDAVDALVVVVDTDHRIVAANKAACKIAPDKEIVGMHCYELFHGMTSPRSNCPFEESMRTGKPARGEWSEPNFKGRWLDVATYPILGKDGLVEQLVHVVRDVTERRWAEERFRLLFESSRDALMTAMPPSGRFMSGNPAALAMFRAKTEAEFLLHGPWDVSPERQPDGRDSAEKSREMIETAMREGTHFFEWTHKRLDGEEFPANVLITRVEQAGKMFILATIRDITDQKHAEEALVARTADLERANEEVKQFAYIVSHDFRSPLVNLKGFAGEIRSSLSVVVSTLETALPHLGEEQRKVVVAALQTDIPEDLQFIETAASNMDSYVNALLKLSRLGRQELHPERLRVNEIVERSLKALAHQMSERGAVACVGPLPEAVADRTAMEQILGNVLTNAVLYLEPGRPGRIEVGGSRGPDETTFFVRDNGRGIAPEDMPKVFAPFRRAGKQDVKGEGMGLAYVRTLVRRHGGEIRCESRPGVGTTFTFTLRNSIEKGKHDAHTPANRA